ncbi:MAG TPA: methyltransferase domain-containing protein, partial [Kofleriaceae bacterium]|nr:methyltransferase domain-containing protein [Kofleriaceae bacterium]
MDLTGFELELVTRRAEVSFADAGGQRTRTLTGAAYDRIESAAAALLAAIEMRIGGACHLELTAIGVDTVARVMRVDVGEPEPKRFEAAGYDGLAAAIADVARVAMGEVRQRKPDPAGTASDASFWASLYDVGGDNWELARATPPLARWCETHPVSGLRTLVVGCGRGHEARLLARLGANVVGIDFAPEAVVQARALAAKDNVSIDFRERDLFALRDDPERYDLVVEHCCF